MKILKRGLVVAATAAASVAFLAGSASAAITPDPYSTTAGTGSFSTSSLLGPGGCRLGGMTANATGTATGATGTISALTASGCTGTITAARYSGPITVSINRGAVTASVQLLINNVVGGACSYAGTLTGSIANGGNTATMSGSMRLVTTLSGFCSSSATVTSLSATFPGASVTW